MYSLTANQIKFSVQREILEVIMYLSNAGFVSGIETSVLNGSTVIISVGKLRVQIDVNNKTYSIASVKGVTDQYCYIWEAFDALRNEQFINPAHAILKNINTCPTNPIYSTYAGFIDGTGI